MTIIRRNHGKGHSYKDEQGNKVPGVTTLANEGFPKGDGLTKWAVEQTANFVLDHWHELGEMKPSERYKRLMGARYESLSKASARGTQVHDIAERLMAGEEVAIPEGFEGYVDAAKSFIDEFDAVAVHEEFTVYSETWKYAGTCDLVADLLDPDDTEPDPALRRRIRWLLDYKTKEKESGVFGDAALQLSAYRCAERMVTPDGEDQPMIEVDRCGIVQIYKDGSYRLVPVEAGEPEFEIFKYAQAIALWKEGNRSLVGDPVHPPRTTTFRLVEVEPEGMPF
jgi:hypothetical protein